VTFLSWAAISDVLRSVTPLVFFDYPVIVYLFFSFTPFCTRTPLTWLYVLTI
jgi:hypothetical protein